MNDIKQEIERNVQQAKDFDKYDLVVSYSKLMFQILPRTDIIENLKKYLTEELEKLKNYYAQDEINEVLQEEYKKILLMISKKVN